MGVQDLPTFSNITEPFIDSIIIMTMTSVSRCTHMKCKSKILVYSDFALVNWAQSVCVLQMLQTSACKYDWNR